MAFYRICPNCGATLDPAEKCDCETILWQQEDYFKQRVNVSPETGQMTFCWDNNKEGTYAEKSTAC